MTTFEWVRHTQQQESYVVNYNEESVRENAWKDDVPWLMLETGKICLLAWI